MRGQYPDGYPPPEENDPWFHIAKKELLDRGFVISDDAEGPMNQWFVVFQREDICLSIEHDKGDYYELYVSYCNSLARCHRGTGAWHRIDDVCAVTGLRGFREVVNLSMEDLWKSYLEAEDQLLAMTPDRWRKIEAQIVSEYEKLG